VPGGRTSGDDIAAVLATWIAPGTARAVVRTFSDRVLGCRPDEIAPGDEVRLFEALRPMVEALVGPGSVEPALSALRSACSIPPALDPGVDTIPAADRRQE
jgi:hypothetical protein